MQCSKLPMLAQSIENWSGPTVGNIDDPSWLDDADFHPIRRAQRNVDGVQHSPGGFKSKIILVVSPVAGDGKPWLVRPRTDCTLIDVVGAFMTLAPFRSSLCRSCRECIFRTHDRVSAPSTCRAEPCCLWCLRPPQSKCRWSGRSTPPFSGRLP